MTLCSTYKKRISRYVDNDLEAADRRAVENHTASCLQCKKTFADYRALKLIVVKSQAIDSAEMQTPPCRKDGRRKTLHFPSLNVGLKLAAMVAITFSLVSGLYFHSASRLAAPFPIVMGRESGTVMNAPLGAIVYYEEIAGKTVHTQYGDMGGAMTIAYESPLFCDTALISQRYHSISTLPVFE